MPEENPAWAAEVTDRRLFVRLNAYARFGSLDEWREATPWDERQEWIGYFNAEEEAGKALQAQKAKQVELEREAERNALGQTNG